MNKEVLIWISWHSHFEISALPDAKNISFLSFYTFQYSKNRQTNTVHNVSFVFIVWGISINSGIRISIKITWKIEKILHLAIFTWKYFVLTQKNISYVDIPFNHRNKKHVSLLLQHLISQVESQVKSFSCTYANWFPLRKYHFRAMFLMKHISASSISLKLSLRKKHKLEAFSHREKIVFEFYRWIKTEKCFITPSFEQVSCWKLLIFEFSNSQTVNQQYQTNSNGLKIKIHENC